MLLNASLMTIFVFQLDSAPVHLAFSKVQLLQFKTLNFLS